MDINEIIDLANSLRQERLFITTEQQTLQSLNEQVVQNSLEVYQAAWISAQQRVNLNRLTVARPNSTPALCCQRASLLETINFVDAFKVLKYQDVLSYGAFLQCLRRAPQLVASCLVLGDRLVSDSMPHIALSLAAGLYGTCLAPEDTNLMLQLLNYLMEMQIVRSETPQRMLRQGSCAFSSLYSVFHEGLFSAKLFLSAALKGPVMQLLMEEEMFLDIDPDKTVIRYPPDERVKKFGKEGTPEFQTKTQQHRKWTVNSLVTITNRFIVSLRDHWLLFPNSVAWLLRQMAALMVKENFQEKELNAMCTDLIFTHFICPAIVNPEPYGVTDAPISHIARFNLMQVAQILQMLALIQYQDVEIKLKDLYSKFDKDSVSTLLDSLLVASESDDIMAVSNTRTPTFIRTATFFTLAELQGFVSFFRLIADDPNPIKSNDVASNCIEQGFKSQLAGLLGPLPSPTDGARGLLRGQGDSNSSNEALSSSPDIPKRGLLGKVSKPRISRISSGSLDNPTEDTSTPATVGTNGNNNLLCSPEVEKFTHNVLIIPFPDVQSELIGLLPEHEVLSHDLPAMPAQSNMTAPILTNTILPEVDISRPVPPDQMTEASSVLTGSTGIEKRTRFSLSHDEGSIGNTSDNLEAVSEAASNHSVASSLELENEDQNDNLSDMVSANVSGRGTPNISGRDTPSSQVTEGGASEPRPPLATPTSKSLKQTRSDIQDKFCKFEIKKLLEGDETISIISDTWSTDVLASDSEIIEAYERSFGMGGHLTSRPPVFAPSQVLTEENNRIMIGPQIPDRVLDVSETQSESAWSTDVLASDSERMTEVDTDDCQSVARSDTDTARSEVDVEARVEPPLPDLPPLGPLQRFPSPISPLPNLSPLFLPQPLSRMERTASTLAKSSRDVPRPDDHGEVRNFEMFHNNFLQNGSLNSPTLVSARNNNPLQRESINEGRFTGRSLSLFEPNTCRLNLLDGSTNRLGSFFNQPRCEVPNPDSLINNSVFHSTSSPFVSSLVNGPFRLFGTQTQNHFDNVTSTDPLCTPHSLSENVQNAHAHVCLNNPSSDVSDSSVAANKISSGVAFRPIHDEKSMFNVTGKGGRLSDYRRRTLEYVNSNSNINLPHSPGSNGDVLENPLEEYNEMVHIESDIPIKEFTNGDNICNGISDLVSQMRSASISDISAHSSTNSTTIQRQSISLSILDDKIIQNKEITINNLILPVVNHIVGADARLPTVDLSVPVEHNNLTAKPSSSTGAIPKSISFDSTAEKAHRDYDDSKMKRGTGNFFNKLKLGFKNRRGKGRGNGDEVRFEDSPIHNIESIKNKRHGYDERVALQSHETTEDILAKYRRKVSISSDVATSGGSDSTASQSSSIKSKSIQSDEQNDSRLKVDRMNRESGYTYEDAKRKLRLVLSTADLQCTDFKHSNATVETPLVSFLRIQLSEAIALQDGALIAQLHEALRSVRAIGAPGSRNLCRELLLEFKGRGQYILYLVQARQALLRTLSYLDRLLTRILCDRSVCNSHLIWECVRLFLERRECQLNSFCDEFRALSVADEKTYLLHTFVNEILRDINRDQNWQAASDHQLLTASLAVERVVMGRVYLQALYPNGDGDISRDQVLYEHIRKLSRIVTVTHKDLRIPLRYHQESPWPYAQSAIQSMAAYRAPRDKVQCVVRCVTTIMHLLSMSGRDGRTVPAADDLIPVLVYVLIKANPPALLSTIQYVDSFYGNCLTGEAQYWWIQFCSAVEFIKTMDYRD